MAWWVRPRAARARGVAAVLCFFLAAAVVADSAHAQPVPGPGAMERPIRPDVVLIVLDDFVVDQLGFLPLTMRRLRERGVEFTNAYATTPLCCPSRASLLTALYAHNHGIRFNENRAHYGDGGAVDFTRRGLDRSTIATWLSDVGYTTSLVGKYLNHYDKLEPPGYVPPGWSDWHVVFRDGADPYLHYWLAENGSIVEYGGSASDYVTDVLREKALDFLRTAPSPYFLYFAPGAPHAPATPAPRHAGSGVDVLAPRKPNYAEPDVSDKPTWVRRMVWDAYMSDRADRLYSDGARCLAAADEAIVAILDQIEARGGLDSALVVFASDNGLEYGAHRWEEKRVPYDGSSRVPIVMVPPGGAPTPRADARPISLIDATATIVAAAGARPWTRVNGRSFFGVLVDKPPRYPIRRVAYFEGWAFPFQDCDAPYFVCGAPTFQAVASQRWKYVVLKNGERELYDLKNDPYELENRIDDPALSSVVRWLARSLYYLSRE